MQIVITTTTKWHKYFMVQFLTSIVLLLHWTSTTLRQKKKTNRKSKNDPWLNWISRPRQIRTAVCSCGCLGVSYWLWQLKKGTCWPCLKFWVGCGLWFQGLDWRCLNFWGGYWVFLGFQALKWLSLYFRNFYSFVCGSEVAILAMSKVLSLLKTVSVVSRWLCLNFWGVYWLCLGLQLYSGVFVFRKFLWLYL